MTKRLAVDFCLSLNDRTGKLFLGRDIIGTLENWLTNVYYGRFATFPKPDLLRRVAGRVMHWETLGRVYWPRMTGLLPLMRFPGPTLHIDPLSVVRHMLESRDIVLCHDVGPITHPHYFAPGVQQLYQCAFEKIQAVRPHLVFISETSKNEFIRLYGDSYPSMAVIYIPIRPAIAKGTLAQPMKMEMPFLLTVGSIGKRKNQLGSIQAFAASGLAEQGWNYIVVGGPEPGADAVISLAEDTPGVRWLGYVSDSQLLWLYRNAAGFVLLSHLEGFGMPIIEAMGNDLVCLVSNSSVLSEVGGTAVLQADPNDIASMASGMLNLVQMPREERQYRIAEGRAHIHNFDREAVLSQWKMFVEPLLR